MQGGYSQLIIYKGDSLRELYRGLDANGCLSVAFIALPSPVCRYGLIYQEVECDVCKKKLTLMKKETTDPARDGFVWKCTKCRDARHRAVEITVRYVAHSYSFVKKEPSQFQHLYS